VRSTNFGMRRLSDRAT